jgi:hypothetical protein
LRIAVPVAEQLDRARREILAGGPVNGRIGLILIDNALELMCRQKATADLPEPAEGFQPALRDHLLARLGRSESDFAIIAKGRGGKDDPKDTLQRVQLEHDTLAELVRVRRDQDKERRRRGLPEEPLDEALLSMARGMPILVELNSKVLPDWRPKHIGLPFSSWRKQAASVATEHQPLRALDVFDRVLREIEALDEVMAEPIYDTHGWNQYMGDVMMDRR